MPKHTIKPEGVGAPPITAAAFLEAMLDELLAPYRDPSDIAELDYEDLQELCRTFFLAGVAHAAVSES